MNDILQKLSNYNIFNYLLPGIVLVALLRFFTSVHLIIEEPIIAAFVYYFIGLTVSRIGSLIIEPILRKSTLIRFLDYKKFVNASKSDEKLELFSEVNNMYRTFISLFLILLLVVLSEQLPEYISLSKSIKTVTLIILLIVLFVFSYKKQTEYISKRIKAQDKE